MQLKNIKISKIRYLSRSLLLKGSPELLLKSSGIIGLKVKSQSIGGVYSRLKAVVLNLLKNAAN